MTMIKPSDLPIISAPPARVTPRVKAESQAGSGPIFNSVGLCGGGYMARSGVERLVGVKRLYHGTSLEAAEQIRKTGLQPQFGGTGAAAPVPGFVKSSTNKCHVTTLPLVAKLFEKHQDPRNALNLLESSEETIAAEVVNSTFSRGGRGLVKLSVPYECFAHMEDDSCLEFGYTTEKGIEPVYVRDGSKNIGARMLKLCRSYPGYVYQFPHRMAGGVVQTTLALMVVKYFSTKLGEQLQDD